MYSFVHDVSATAETSVISLIDVHPTKRNLEGGNYFAAKLLFTTCLSITAILNLNTLSDKKVGISCVLSR